MSLHPDCLAELNLLHAPFDALPSEDFVYSDELIEELVNGATAAIAGSGAILLITGEPGSGRSMQLMRLLGALPENYELIAFRARMNTRFEAVDFTIRNHLRAGGHDDPDRPLSDLMGERIRAGFDPVIAVDDAHLLGMDIINILLRMRGEILGIEGRAPRLVLVGDQVLLRRRLQLRPADEHQIARFTLRPFNLEQTAAYLRHRLRAAGLADPGDILTEEVMAELQAESRGLPGALNDQANRWLERLCRERMGTGEDGPPEPERPAVPAAQAAQAAQAARRSPALGVTGDPPDEPPEDLTPFARREPYASITEDVLRAAEDDGDRIARSRAKVRLEDEETPVPFWNRTWFVPAVATLVAFLIIAPFARHLFERPAEPPAATVQLPIPAVPEPAPEAAAEPAWGDDPSLTELAFDDRTPAEVPLPDPAPMPLPDPAPSPAPGSPPAPEAVPQPEVLPTPVPAPDPALRPEARPAPAPSPTRPTPAPTTEPTAPATPTPAAPAGPPSVDLAGDRNWLARQDPAHFTIQLIAAPDLAGAQRFVETHQLSGIRYIQTRSGGRDFVVALAGSFPSRPAAEAALGSLPSAVRSERPWIRSLGSVRDIQR